MPKSWFPLLVGLVNLLTERAHRGDLIEHTDFSAEHEAMVARRTAELSESQEASRVHDFRDIFAWEHLGTL